MRVSIYHNVTVEDGHLAIFWRMGDEPRTQPGDELLLVGTLDFPTATTVTQAAELAFEAGNSPAATEAIKQYRSWRVRSLSVGDVVTVEADGDHLATLDCRSTGWALTDLAQFTLTDTVTVSLDIHNAYELYEDVDTTVTDVVVPAPPADVDSEDYDEWAYDHINRFTGVGHTDGDSWYDVRITASTDPALVGRTFEWGY